MTESFCPEEGWVARAPLPAGRVGHCLVTLAGKLYRYWSVVAIPQSNCGDDHSRKEILSSIITALKN